MGTSSTFGLHLGENGQRTQEKLAASDRQGRDHSVRVWATFLGKFTTHYLQLPMVQASMRESSKSKSSWEELDKPKWRKDGEKTLEAFFNYLYHELT